jgi:hypothetical protein
MHGLSIGADCQVRPPAGGAEVVAIDDIVCLIASGCLAVFDGPPSEDFLQEIT